MRGVLEYNRRIDTIFFFYSSCLDIENTRSDARQQAKSNNNSRFRRGAGGGKEHRLRVSAEEAER